MAGNQSIAKLAKYFDVTIETKLASLFSNPTVDKFFIFSTLPSFENFAQQDHKLVPVAFSVAFRDGSSPVPPGQINVLGSQNTLHTPRRPGQKVITISGAAVVTDAPKEVIPTTGEVSQTENVDFKTNFIKRIYYPLISFKDGKLFKAFLSKYGDGSLKRGKYGFLASGYDENSLLSNFSSEMYDIPVGILTISLSKSSTEIDVKFYSHCTLISAPEIQADTRMVSLPGVTASFVYTDVYQLSLADLNLSTDNEYSEFINDLKEYFGVK